MSDAASAHPAPKPCGRNRRELDDLRARIKKGELDNADYFFTNNTYESQDVQSQFLPRADLLPDMPRCIKCGCTIDEHLPEVNNQQPKTCGGLLLKDRVQGVVVNLRLFKDDPMSEKRVAMFPVVDVVIDTGCNFTLILASAVFDEMVELLELKPVQCRARVTNKQTMDQFIVNGILRSQNGGCCSTVEVICLLRDDFRADCWDVKYL